jgi:hypothetical protein
MRIRLLLVLLVLLALALSSSRPAPADTIDTSGTFGSDSSLLFSLQQGLVILAGERGFRVRARTETSDTFLGPWQSCGLPRSR